MVETRLWFQFTSEFVQSHLLSRRLAHFCCRKLSQICTDSSASLSPPNSQSPATAAAATSATNEWVKNCFFCRLLSAAAQLWQPQW